MPSQTIHLRLAVSIKCHDISGKQFHVWLKNTRGTKIAMRMNNLVDTLEGLSYEETRMLRRWLRSWVGKKMTSRFTSYSGE